MLQSLLILFILVPILEIYLLISVGSVIGAGSTIFLVLLTAVIGTLLLRHQGLYTMTKAQQQIAAGEMPTQAMFEGILLLLSGALLLTPGFFTDSLGLLLLIPAVRQALMAGLLRRVVSGAVNGVHRQGGAPHQTRTDHAAERPQAGRERGQAHTPTTIEGEYTHLDD